MIILYNIASLQAGRLQGIQCYEVLMQSLFNDFNNFPTRCDLFSLLHFCSQLYMLETQQRERMVVDPVKQYQKLYLQLYELLMMGVNTRNMQSCLQKCNKLNKSHLVAELLNSIHDARTHVYKIYLTTLFVARILSV